MPRSLPTQLKTAMDAGNFTAYIAIGKRNYTGDPPTALSGYTTLITEVLYYKYDGLELVVKYHSANLPAADGLTVGNKYYIERGVKISGTPYTIKSASLRFDDYRVEKEIITAYFSLFSNDERPSNITGDDTYTNVLTDLNPNDYWLGTVDFKTTVLNFNHWGYQFYPDGKFVILKSYQSVLPLLRQKWLLQAVDNSDDDNENEVQYFHLISPVNGRVFTEPTDTARGWSCAAWSESLGRFVIGGNTYFAWSDNGMDWTEVAYGSSTWTAIAWAPTLGKFVALSTTHMGTSTDGKTWTVSATAAGTNPNDLAWSESLGLFVMVNGTANLYYSSNGTTWNYTTKTGAIYAVEWSEDTAEFVAVGNGVCWTSTDGTTWTSRTIQAATWVDIEYSADLTLFAAVANNGAISTSPDGHTWTAQTVPNSNARYGISWSPYNQLFLAVASTGTGNRLLTSPDGATWTEGTTGTDASWYRVVWGQGAHNWVIIANTGTVQLAISLESLVADHTITRGDVVLLKDGVTLKFMWRDELGTVHTDGGTSSLIHNLGYMESTDDPPNSYASNERGSVTVGIHLKYKTGDIFKLAINSSHSSTYIGRVTEILDTSAKIGWRCEIELIDRFANTNGGALPSTIERIAAYTPLVTTDFDNNLDATVNNLQALADAVDDLDISGSSSTTQSDIYSADAKTTPANSDLFALLDSAASYVIKNITWSNIKAALKTYFDSLYSSTSHTHTENGWTAAPDAWTRTGNYTFTVSGDVTADYEYQPGTKIKVTDTGGTKYGVIESTSYSSPNTTVTLVTNNDYLLASGTLSSPYISHHRDPEGFPEFFDYSPSWSAKGSMSIASVSVNYAKYSIQGRMCFAFVSAEFTLGIGADNIVYASPPVTCDESNQIAGAINIRDAGSGGTIDGQLRINSTNGFSCLLRGGGNWSLGSGRQVHLTAIFSW